jgi:hypothetical protein
VQVKFVELCQVWNSRTKPQAKLLKFRKFVRSEVSAFLQAEVVEAWKVTEFREVATVCQVRRETGAVSLHRQQKCEVNDMFQF